MSNSRHDTGNIPVTEALEKISQVPWYHSFELLPGVVTPGSCVFNAKELFDLLGIPRDLSGKRALDIGTLDGPAAFDLEARGATVVALDILDPNQTGFNTAKEILQSKVSYAQASVYDLSRIFSEKFDIICFFGVFYHLKHPLMAFEEIQKIIADDGLLLFEGECLRNYAETVDGVPVSNESLAGLFREFLGAVKKRLSVWPKRIRQKSRGLFFHKPLARFWRVLRPKIANRPPECSSMAAPHKDLYAVKSLNLAAIANSNVPLTLFYSGKYKNDSSNWFIPNFACFRSWLTASGLEIVSYWFNEDPDAKPHPGQRIAGIARKAAHPILREY